MALLAAVNGCAVSSPQTQTQPRPASTLWVAEGSWEVMPEAPLSPRGAVTATWTGDHLLLLGGERTDGEVPECGPAASCVGPPVTGLQDGAAWDPVTRTWVHLRSALPEALDSPSLLSRDPGVWSGTQLLTRSSAITPDLAAGTLAIDHLELGPALVYAEPVWTGQELVGIGWDYGAVASGVEGQLVAQVLDPATGQERAVPWPFDPPGAESARTVWTGQEVIAFVAVQTPSSHSTRVVAFDPDADTWRLVTDSFELPFSLAWDGQHVQVVTQNQLLALDPATGATTSSAALPDGGAGALLASPEGRLLLSGQRTYLRTTSAGTGSGQEPWRRLPELPTQVETQQRTTAWAGEQIVVWGGKASGIEGESSTNTAEGWTLTPS